MDNRLIIENGKIIFPDKIEENLSIVCEQGKIINSKFIECESYGDSFYSSFPIYESYILYLSNSHADMNEFNKCYCTSTDSSKKSKRFLDTLHQYQHK